MDQMSRRLRFVFVLIPAGFMTLVLVAPALQGLVLSFDACGPSLSNYERLAKDSMFWQALGNNLVVPLGSLALELVLGLLLALYLTSSPRPSAVVGVLAILPFAIPEIVLLALARYLFIQRGYVNAALLASGLSPLGWLTPNRSLALLTVVLVDAWHVTPVVMLVLMAGLQGIAPEVYEAALLDGAGTFATFRYITLPLLVPSIVAAVVLRGVDALRIFSTTLVLTGAEGVPVLSTYAYQLWSDAREPHIAMAVSVMLALMITVLALLLAALSQRFTATQPGSAL
jgi:ABC-type sugar transport system permease subunit